MPPMRWWWPLSCMSDVIEQTMRKASFIVNPSYEDYVATDTEARRLAAELF